MKYNIKIQDYRGIKIRLIKYTDKHFARLNAKRFLLIKPVENDYPSQNFWIPNCYLEPDGTLKPNINIDWVFVKAYRQNKLKYAGINVPSWVFRKVK